MADADILNGNRVK